MAVALAEHVSARYHAVAHLYNHRPMLEKLALLKPCHAMHLTAASIQPMLMTL